MREITQHKFSDTIANIKCTNASDESVSINTNGAAWIFLHREDAQALAKHFNFTAEELHND